MALDLQRVKEKLNNLNNKGKKKTYEKIDYGKLFFKPQPGKYQIRFVPSKFDRTNPFKEVYFHYGLKNFPLVALTNYGEKDPIVDFCTELKKSQDKDNWALAKKLSPKMRVFAPIIVRGEEDKGVRLWEFGTLVYKQLLGMADDEDYGDFTDVAEGRDFTLDAVEGETAGRKSTNCSLRIKPKTTPLSTNPDDINSWLENQPNVLDVRKHYTYDELKAILAEWLNPEEAKEQPSTTTYVAPEIKTVTHSTPEPVLEEVGEEKAVAPVVTQTAKVKTPKKAAAKSSSADKFEELFK